MKGNLVLTVCTSVYSRVDIVEPNAFLWDEGTVSFCNITLFVKKEKM